MRRTTLCLLISLALIACQETDPLLGQWYAYDSSIGPTKFKSMSLDLGQEGSYKMLLGGANIRGSWELVGDTITLSPVTSDARTPSGEFLPGTESLEMTLTLTVSEDSTELTLKKHMVKGAGTLVFTKG